MNDINMPLANIEALTKTIINRVFRTLNVCLPATVISYDNSKNTVKLQPAIQAVTQDKSFKNLPILLNVPVLELGGAGLSVKIPLQAGDTGIVIFCDRGITLFKQEKKNTQPNTLRKHDLSDGIFIPMKFGNSGSSNISIQNTDGSVKFEITSSGINVKGNIVVDGEITATDVKTDTNISLKSHKHLGVRAGSDTSGLPTM